METNAVSSVPSYYWKTVSNKSKGNETLQRWASFRWGWITTLSDL
ncbi:hypothetical protein [Halocatena salina]|nr:hypothetical protein [Halocatena salina]